MRRFALCLVTGLVLGGPASAAMVTEKIPYTLDGTAFEGVLVYDDSVTGKRPAVLMAPNWMGVTAPSIEKAKTLAGGKYVLLVADMYGANVRPKDGKEAGAAAGAVRKDLAMHRARVNKAVDVLLAEGGKRNLIDESKVAAIGFCFGGGNVLELARSGRDVKGVVSFHGSLTTPQPQDAAKIKAKVLVLHGAADPAVPKADRDALEAELSAAPDVDWQLIAFSGAVHSFTDPNANRKGRAEYNEKVAKRAYAMMYDFFDEIF